MNELILLGLIGLPFFIHWFLDGAGRKPGRGWGGNNLPPMRGYRPGMTKDEMRKHQQDYQDMVDEKEKEWNDYYYGGWRRIFKD